MALKQAQIAEANKSDKSSGGGAGDIMSMFSGGEGGGLMDMMGGEGGAEGLMSMFGGAKYGGRIPRAQVGESIYDPSTQSGLPTYNPMADPSYAIGQNQQIVGESTAPQGAGGAGFMNNALKAVPIAGDLISGIKGLKAEKEAAARANQQKIVSGLQLTASATRPEEIQRKYVRPEDVAIQPNQMFPTYGVGTNPLARDGIRLQSGGEIQNTYAPDYLYDDLGYEPLNDSNVKQYYRGGNVPKAQGGFSNYMNTLGGGGGGFSGAGAAGATPWGAIGGIGSNVANSAAGGGNASGQIGGAIGSGLGAAFGPAGMAIGKTLGTAVGNAVSPYAKKIKRDEAATKRNIENTAYNNMAPGFIAPYEAHARDGASIPNYEDGGYMNPEYNPQVITMFGDHTAEDFADYARKYRAGGHLKSYTPPSERAMEIYEDGGEIKTNQMGGISIESGGYLEPISWNPYTGGTGFTSKFHGQSHVEQDPDLDHTGIIMKYGGNADQQNGYQMEEGGDAEGNRIEAERGEYISERKDGGEAGESAQISGNRRYNPKLYDLGPKFNKEYANMKVKAIQGKIAEDDRKINIKESKNSQELTSFDPKTPQDKLYEGSLIANQLGYQMQYGINAAKANNILAWQNSANGIIDEISSIHGKEINGDDFVKSGGTKINYEKEPLDSSKSKNGNKFMKAEEGITIDPGKITKAQRAAYLAKGYKQDPKDPNRLYLPGTSKEVITKIPGSEAQIKKGSGPIKDTYKGPKMSNADWAAFLKTKKGEAYKQKYITGTPDEVIKAAVPPSEKKEMITTPEDEVIVEGETPAPEEKTKFPWQMYVNALLPYFRPTDQEAFDYAQLYPEMYALGSNQLEPVPVQGYRPDLGTPYDISLQANMNEITAQTRAAQKMAQGNPAAQALIAGQAYDAINKVKEKEFIANQEMKDRVYGENRNILNQAKLTNLDIFDRQYGRQAEARSNTKATTQAALNSMADKMAKHKLENKTLGIYENLYNYRFGKDEVADNWNPLAQFNMQGRSNIGSSKDAAPEGYEYETILKKKKPSLATNSISNSKNGSIVKSYKNI
jgi:hypothetical protein